MILSVFKMTLYSYYNDVIYLWVIIARDTSKFINHQVGKPIVWEIIVKLEDIFRIDQKMKN